MPTSRNQERTSLARGPDTTPPSARRAVGFSDTVAAPVAETPDGGIPTASRHTDPTDDSEDVDTADDSEASVMPKSLPQSDTPHCQSLSPHGYVRNTPTYIHAQNTLKQLRFEDVTTILGQQHMEVRPKRKFWNKF